MTTKLMSRACAGDDVVPAVHEFCSFWHYVDGRRVFYCECECHVGRLAHYATLDLVPEREEAPAE